ncbi:MAG: hypothetical protein ACQEXJ_04595 [Myxococcota bacterium]
MLGLAMGVAVISAQACRGGCRGEGGDATRVVPEEARGVAVVPSLEALRGRLVAFLAGVEGASGALDLVEARYGVNLSDADGLREVGIDPDGSAALFAVDEAGVLAVSVSDDDAFADLVSSRAVKWAGARVEERHGEAGLAGIAEASARPKEAALGDAGPRWKLAWGTTEDGVGVVVLTPGEADPAERWRALAGGAGGFAVSDLAGRARDGLGDAPGLWLAVRRSPSVPPGLGTVGALLAPYLEPLSTWTGHVGLEAEGLTARVDGVWEGEGTFPVGWFRPKGEPEALAEHFPKALTAFARVRADAGSLRNMPSFLRERVLPSTMPGPVGKLLPSPAEWLDLAAGDVAVALLGIDDEATVEQLVRAQRRPDVILQLLHAGVGLTVRDPAEARRHVEATRERFEGAGWTTARIEGKAWEGVGFRKGEHAWSALLRDDVMVLLSGSGEVERFLAVAEGRALPLTAMAEGGGVRAEALTDPQTGVGVLLTFTRITRELADKGLPPYFLQIINDVRSVALAFRPREDGVGLALDVAL